MTGTCRRRMVQVVEKSLRSPALPREPNAFAGRSGLISPATCTPTRDSTWRRWGSKHRLPMVQHALNALNLAQWQGQASALLRGIPESWYGHLIAAALASWAEGLRTRRALHGHRKEKSDAASRSLIPDPGVECHRAGEHCRRRRHGASFSVPPLGLARSAVL